MSPSADDLSINSMGRVAAALGSDRCGGMSLNGGSGSVAVPRRCRKQTFSLSFVPVHTDRSLSPVSVAAKAEMLTAKLAVAVY